MKHLIIALVVMLTGLILASPAQAYPTMPQRIQGPFTVSRLSTVTPSTWTPTASASRSG